MKCKSCDKEITVVSNFATGALSIIPTCRCGKIRVQERLKGCPKCNEFGTGIQVKKKWYGYLLFCTCGHKWRVRE